MRVQVSLEVRIIIENRRFVTNFFPVFMAVAFLRLNSIRVTGRGWEGKDSGGPLGS